MARKHVHHLLQTLGTYGLLLTSFAIVGILVAVSIWDVCLITSEYLTSNRVTLVTWKSANDTYPFFNDSKLQICLVVSKQGETLAYIPNIGRHEPDVEDLTNLSMALEKTCRKLNDGGELTPSDRRAILTAFKFIDRMDTDLINRSNCAHNEPLCPTDVHQPSSALDKILENETLIEALELSLWKVLRENLILDTTNPNLTSLVSLSPEKVCVDIDLSQGLNPKSRAISYDLGLFDKDAWDQLRNQSTESSISLKMHDYDAFFMSLPTEDHLHVGFMINNVGILDKTATTPSCTDEPYIDFVDDYILHPCRPAGAARIIAEACGCVPFSKKRLFVKVDPAFDNLPFCTRARYDSCQDRVRSQTDELFSRDCRPFCRQVKSQYICQKLLRPDICHSVVAPGNRSMCSNMQLTITNTDVIHAIYEERPQLTPTQFVGQVGGDIGLYTGLSIFSIWQFLTCLHGAYRKYKTCGSDEGEGGLTEDGRPASVATRRGFLKLAMTEMGIESMLVGWERKSVRVSAETSSVRANETKGSAKGGMEAKVNELSEQLNEMKRAMDKMRSKVMSLKSAEDGTGVSEL